MENFDGLSLHPNLVESLQIMKYDKPTPVQAQCIPLAMDGRDIMGSAQTGTGKTAAFAIPLVDSLMNNPKGSALVLTPTRELGKQVMDIMQQLLGRNSGISTAFLIGGDSMSKQINQIRKNPRLVVGTPGRINDHLERGSLKLDHTRFLVLDETDRMLDMGFSVQLDRINKYLPSERQTLMFSATMPSNIMQMAAKYLKNPERISVGSTIEPAKNIKQEVVKVKQEQKYEALQEILETRAGSIVMFVKTKYGTERMAKRLKNDGFVADALHGDLKQSRRSRVVQNFRDMKFQILVATDVAARGLDIPHIEHVINYDLPQVPEDFIHRIGRTARAGAKGEAISFVSPQEAYQWLAIEQLMDPTMKGAAMPNRKAAKPRSGAYKGRPTRGKKPFGKKPFDRDDDRRDGKKPFSKSKKPFGKKPFRKEGNRDEQRSDKPYGKKPFAKKPFRKEGDRNDKPQDGRGFANKKTGFKPKAKPEGGSFEGRKEGGKPFTKKSGAKTGAKNGGGKKPFGTSNKPTNGASKKHGAKKSGFKGRPASASGGFKGKSSTGGGKKFSGGPNKARPATGGGKRPRTRTA